MFLFRYIVEVWTGSKDKIPIDLLEIGYEVIFATVDAWYLDHGFDGSIIPYHDWKTVYDNAIPRHEKGNFLFQC